MNREILQMAAKEMPIFGRHSRIMFDAPASQLTQEMQSVKEFATNEVYRPILANVAYAYKDTENEFISDFVAPFFPVTALSGTYRKLNERTFFDQPNVAAAKDTPPNRLTWGSSLVNYDLTGRALAIYMSNVDRDEAINQFGSVEKWRQINTMILTRLLLLDRELTVASLYQTSGNYAAGFTAVAAPLWSNNAATIQADIATGEDKLLTPRDMIILGHNVYRTLQTHPAVTGSTLVSGAQRNVLKPYANEEAIGNFFDSKIIVGRARYNSTPAAATPTMTRIWAGYAIPCHIAEDPGSPEMSAPFVRTFKLKSTSFPNAEGWTVKSVMDSNTMAGGEVLMVGYYAQELIFAQKSGYLLQAL